MSHGKKHSSGFEWSVVVFVVFVTIWLLSKLARYIMGAAE